MPFIPGIVEETRAERRDFITLRLFALVRKGPQLALEEALFSGFDGFALLLAKRQNV